MNEKDQRDEAKKKVLAYFRERGVDHLVPEGHYLAPGRPGIIVRNANGFHVAINMMLDKCGSMCVYIYSGDATRRFDCRVRKELQINRDGLEIKWNDKPRKNGDTSRHVCDFHRKGMSWRNLTDQNLKTLLEDYTAVIAGLEKMKAFG